MPEPSEYKPGTPSWVDLSSPDVEQSARFYGDLFGWEHQSAGEEAGGYGFFNRDGKMVAGVGPTQQEGQPPMWMTYVTVADAEETAGKVSDAGGEVVVEPMDVLESGRMAVFKDPTGAFISVWEPKQHKGAQVVNEPGAYAWSELTTREPDQAKPFYEAVFGWGTTTMDYQDVEYTIWQAEEPPEDNPNAGVGGMMPMGEDFPDEVPSHWMVYFAVDDVEATVRKVEEAGGKVSVPPFDTQVGPIAVLEDPAGAVFSVIKPRPPESGDSEEGDEGAEEGDEAAEEEKS